MSAPPLTALHDAVDTRVRLIREQHPDWLCAKGCAACCRQLADLPRLSAAEWALLREGLATLPADEQARIGAGIAALATTTTRPLTCPMLDQASGACPVYAWRPVACRSYGFYAQRDRGLYCGEIEAQVDGGRLADVVWGNHDAIDRELTTLGETRSLPEWYAATAADD